MILLRQHRTNDLLRAKRNPTVNKTMARQKILCKRFSTKSRILRKNTHYLAYFPCPPRSPAGNPNLRELAGSPVGKHDLQLAQHHVPILAPGMPVPDDPPGCQVQHPPQRIVVGERRLVLCDLLELPVQPLDDVRRVYDFPNFRRVFKEGTQNLPVFLPALHTGGILLAPLGCEGL